METDNKSFADQLDQELYDQVWLNSREIRCENGVFSYREAGETKFKFKGLDETYN